MIFFMHFLFFSKPKNMKNHKKYFKNPKFVLLLGFVPKCPKLNLASLKRKALVEKNEVG